MTGAFLLLALLAAAVQPPPASAPAPSTAPAPHADADLESQLREIDRRNADVRDLTADFEQTRTSVLLKNPLVSKGTVKVKGPRTLWKTTSPRPSTMLIDDSEMRIYYPDQKSMEVYALTDSLRRIAATPLPRLDDVRRHFDIARVELPAGTPEHMLGIELSPREPSLRERVQSVRVTIDRRAALAVAVTITDADGERTVLAFSNTRANTGLDDGAVALEVPEGTRVSRPLEGLPPGEAAAPRGAAPERPR